MEKTSDAMVVPMNAGWNDVGSWSSLWDISHKDDDGNKHNHIFLNFMASFVFLMHTCVFLFSGFPLIRGPSS